MDRFETVEIREKDSPGANFLYHTVPGRCLLQLLIRPGISRAAGWFLDRAVSRHLVRPFIRATGLSLEDYEKGPYPSFNGFFTRRVLPGRRPIGENPEELIAPCDGKLTAYPITEDAVFRIKHSDYSVEALLEDTALAETFRGGTCLIFRLTPDDFHRYCFPDDGQVLASRFIPGVLHTVRPIAFERYPVYLRNSREYTFLETVHFGNVLQMEVGALFVGRIVNHPVTGPFIRGQEKGMFEFGGSTVILLLEPDKVLVDALFFENTRNGKETVVKMGTCLGTRNSGQSRN